MNPKVGIVLAMPNGQILFEGCRVTPGTTIDIVAVLDCQEISLQPGLRLTKGSSAKIVPFPQALLEPHRLAAIIAGIELADKDAGLDIETLEVIFSATLAEHLEVIVSIFDDGGVRFILPPKHDDIPAVVVVPVARLAAFFLDDEDSSPQAIATA